MAETPRKILDDLPNVKYEIARVFNMSIFNAEPDSLCSNERPSLTFEII